MCQQGTDVNFAHQIVKSMGVRVVSVIGQLLAQVESKHEITGEYLYTVLDRLHMFQNMTYQLYSSDRTLLQTNENQQVARSGEITAVFTDVVTGIQKSSMDPLTDIICFNDRGTAVLNCARRIRGAQSLLPSNQYESVKPQKYRSKYTALIQSPSTLIIRSKQDNSLVGYEYFRDYDLWSCAFDDQGRYCAVLTTRKSDDQTMLIVINERS